MKVKSPRSLAAAVITAAPWGIDRLKPNLGVTLISMPRSESASTMAVTRR